MEEVPLVFRAVQGTLGRAGSAENFVRLAVPRRRFKLAQILREKAKAAGHVNNPPFAMEAHRDNLKDFIGCGDNGAIEGRDCFEDQGDEVTLLERRGCSFCHTFLVFVAGAKATQFVTLLHGLNYRDF